MKNKRLFLTVGIAVSLYAVAVTSMKNTDQSMTGPVQTISLSQVDEPSQAGLSTKLFFPEKPGTRQSNEAN